MSIQDVNALLEYIGADSADWENLSVPIAQNLLIYSKDDNVFKLGNGVDAYSALAVIFDMNRMSHISQLLTAFPEITIADAGKILSVNAAGDGYELSTELLSSYVTASALTLMLTNKSLADHNHNDIYPLKSDVDLAMSTGGGLDIRSQDLVSYLVLNELDRDTASVMDLPNGFADEFADAVGIDASNTDFVLTDGYYAPTYTLDNEVLAMSNGGTCGGTINAYYGISDLSPLFDGDLGEATGISPNVNLVYWRSYQATAPYVFYRYLAEPVKILKWEVIGPGGYGAAWDYDGMTSVSIYNDDTDELIGYVATPITGNYNVFSQVLDTPVEVQNIRFEPVMSTDCGVSGFNAYGASPASTKVTSAAKTAAKAISALRLLTRAVIPNINNNTILEMSRDDGVNWAMCPVSKNDMSSGNDISIFTGDCDFDRSFVELGIAPSDWAIPSGQALEVGTNPNNGLAALKLTGDRYADDTDIFTGGTVTFNPTSPYGAVRDATTLFDGDISDGWYPSDSYCDLVLPWVIYDFGEGNEKTLFAYDMKASSRAGASGYPRDWTISGSNDGENWTVVDEVSGVTTGWTQSVVFNYTCANPGSYRYYKLQVTYANNTSGTRTVLNMLGQWIGYGVVDTIADLPQIAYFDLSTVEDIYKFYSPSYVYDPVNSGVDYAYRFGDEFRKWNPSTSVWVVIARNENGIWQYRNGSIWYNAPENTAESALSYAFTIVANRNKSDVFYNLTYDKFVETPDAVAVSLRTSSTTPYVTEGSIKGSTLREFPEGSLVRWRLRQIDVDDDVTLHGIRVRWAE